MSLVIGGCQSGSSGGVFRVPSDQIFTSTAERDSFFAANPSKLFIGAQCVITTNQPEGLYQVYSGTSWVDNSAVIVGPKGDEPFKTVKVTMLPAGSTATSDINGTELDLGIPRAAQSPSARQAVRFLGMFETESELNLQEPSPREGSQCIVLTPTQNYYEFTKGVWTKGREVGDAHNGYLGRYADEVALKLAHPTAPADSTSIAGKAWFIYETNAWEPLQDDHIPAIDNKLQNLEEGQQVLQSNIDQKISGINVEDSKGNSYSDITGLDFGDSAELGDPQGSQKVPVNVKPKITVANGQEPSSSSVTGNAIVIEGSTVESDPNDPNVVIIKVPVGSGINLGDGVNQSREVQTVILRGHEAYGTGNTAEIHLEFAHFKTIAERDVWSTKFGQGMNFDTVAVVDVGDNGAISWYKFNAATKAWEDYEIIHNGNQVLSVGQQWGGYHSVSKVYDIETRYPIEVATGKQNPSDPEEKVAILTIKPGVYEPHHSNSCLLKLDMVESIAGQKPHNIYMTEEVVPTGTFFNLNSQNQGIDVQDNTGGDTALTGGQLTEALVKVEFLDSAPEDGNVKVWLEYKDPSDPIDKKILLDVNGVPLAVEKQFKANDKIGYFVLAGGFLAKATQTLKVVVETSFSSNSKITLDPLNTMICLNQFGEGYETSIARIEFLRRAALQITPAIQKFSSTMLSLVDELDGITEGPTTITSGAGYDTLNEFGIQNLTDVSVEIKDNAITVKDTGSIADFYFDTLIDNTHTRMLRGKQVSSAITIANPNNAFEFEAYKWTGKPDAVTKVYSSRTDGSININVGWTVIKGIFIAEQANGNAYGHTLTFDVPDDANNIIVLVRPQAAQSPSTMVLSGFDWGSSEFTGYVEIERYNIREEHLRFDESYAEYLYTNEGYAATRYTINNTPSTGNPMPVGKLSKGKAPIERDGTVNQVPGSQLSEYDGAIKFLKDGEASISKSYNVWNETGTDNTVTFWDVLFDVDGNETKIPESEKTVTIKANTGAPGTIITIPAYAVDVEIGQRIGGRATSNVADGAFVQSQNISEYLVQTIVDFEELKPVVSDDPWASIDFTPYTASYFNNVVVSKIVENVDAAAFVVDLPIGGTFTIMEVLQEDTGTLGSVTQNNNYSFVWDKTTKEITFDFKQIGSYRIMMMLSI